MTRQEAIEALQAQGIRNPSEQLVSDWLRMQQSQEWALELTDNAPELRTGVEQEPSSPGSAGSENPTPPRPLSSKSNLKPLLQERGELLREHPRRPGRPKIIAPWYQAVATAMADGTPLREALSICGIYGLTPKQIRSLYRNRAFQALYREARRKWWAEVGVHHRRPTARPKGCKGADCVGASLRKMLRTL